MYPLVQIGPLRLSSGGLLLLAAVVLASVMFERAARRRGGQSLAEQAERHVLPVVLGAIIGARFWYGLFNWDLYSRAPSQFLLLRVGDLSWSGALLGGMFVGYVWTRWRRSDGAALADCAALALPLPQALASLGLVLSGEAFGVPTALPWGIPLFGATRHPTQLYLAVAALATFGVVRWLAAFRLPSGMLFAAYLGLQGITLLLVEALRADSLTFAGGVRAAQVIGLVLLLGALHWMHVARHASDPAMPSSG